MDLKFEWDHEKDASNEDKHGIAFSIAVTVFKDPHHLEEDSTRPEHGERRSMAIGMIGMGEAVIAVVFTDRGTSGGSSQPGGRGEMSERDMIRARLLPDGSVVQEMDDGTTRPMESRTDWKRLAAMTEEEIEANALADEDNPPMTAGELARMRRVPNPRAIRERLHLTQEQFSLQFELPLGTVRDWELGRRHPDSAAKTLLRVIDTDPEAVLHAIARSY